MIALTIITHCAGCSSQCNKTRKLHDKCKYWEGRGGLVSIYKLYNWLSGKSRKSNEKVLELIKEFKFDSCKIKKLKINSFKIHRNKQYF